DQPVITGNQSNPIAGFQEEFDAGKTGEGANQQYMLFPMCSTGLTNPQNKEGYATFDGEQDDIIKKDKGKSPIDYFTGNRDFNADFKDYSEDSSNDVTAAGPIVPAAGQNYSNSTNPISAAEREDIVYSDHENVGSDADFNNLETSITVKQKEDGIFINQDKYVAEILKKFRLTEGKSASTPIDIEKPLLKDPDGEDNTASIKQSNDVTKLQALVNKKKVVVTEATIRDALHLDYAEGVDCLPNEEIFTTSARMGYEKPSTKLTFYKDFFSSQWNSAMAVENYDQDLPRLLSLRVISESDKISGALTDEAVQNGSIKKVEKRGNAGEPSKDKNGRDDNKRTRTRNAFASNSNPVGRDDTKKDCRGVPKNVNAVNARNLTVMAYYECGSIDHVWSACPRLNRAQGPKGNHPNQVVANNEGQGRRNQRNRARASGKLVEIDKVIKSCKLEIEGHVFDIDLIPFGHGSFDVIIGMDWLSNHKAKIICHDKVVRIPLPDGKVLRVLGERPEEKVRLLLSAEASDKK
nr:putative reverse transcriptase domain-containing protein [Tanacetum cinerariifolium]